MEPIANPNSLNNLRAAPKTTKGPQIALNVSWLSDGGYHELLATDGVAYLVDGLE